MNKSLLTIFILFFFACTVSICTAGTSSDPTDYPSYYPPDEPVFTVEPSQVGGDTGWISVDSSPQGADVYFDGVPQGTTPVTVSVSTTGAPSHSIRVSKSGYQDWTGHISGNPSPGETLYQYANLVETQPTFTVEPTQIGGDHGWVYVDSLPQGATVYFDGVYEGLTPISVSVSSTGTPSHSIRLSKSGYLDWNGQVSGNPLPGQTIYADVGVLVEVQPTITIPPTIVGDDFGWFKIVPIPEQSDVTFDTSYIGTGTQLVKVYTTATPSHNLIVRKNGYSDYRQHLSYNPGRGETVTLYASLVPLTQYGSIVVTSDPSGALATLDSGQH